MSDSSLIEYLRHESNNRTDKDRKLLPEDNTIATRDKDFPPELYDGGVFRESGTYTNSEGVVKPLMGTRSYFIPKDSYTRTVEEYTEKYYNGEMEERFLWAQFLCDFFAWSKEWFTKVEKPALIKLRETLRSRVVYVNQSEDVANTLYNTLVTRGSLDWPDDDVWSMKPNYGTYTSEFEEIDQQCAFSERFSGHEKNLSLDFSKHRRTFVRRCRVEGVPEKNWYLGFNIMLKGPALTYYRETLSGRDLDFSDLCRKLVDRYGVDESVLEESD